MHNQGMLTERQIRNTILSLKKDYKGYKDGGREFITQLAKKINRVDENQKQEVFKFFLLEIESSSNRLTEIDNKMAYIGLATFIEMKAFEMIEPLKLILSNDQKKNNQNLKESIQRTIIELTTF